MVTRVTEHVPSLTGYVGEKSFIDLVAFSETPRGNRYILTVMDGFSRYAYAYPLPNKEAVTVARMLLQEFVNKLWKELM